MDEQTYMNERLKEQIDWYNTNSSRFKKYHDYINIGSIICSTSGSFVTILSLTFSQLEPWLTIIGAVIGVIVAVAISVDKLKRFGELHVVYRKTCESLKRELYLYQTESSEYNNNPNAFNLLVERCESIMATENGSWAQLNEKKKD